MLIISCLQQLSEIGVIIILFLKTEEDSNF